MRRGERPEVKATSLVSEMRHDTFLTCHLADVAGERMLVWLASRIHADHIPLLAVEVPVDRSWKSKYVEQSLVDAMWALASFSSENLKLRGAEQRSTAAVRIYPQELAELILSEHVTRFLELNYGKPKEEFGSVKPLDRYPAIPIVYNFLSACGQANPLQILVMATGRSRASVNKDVWQSRALAKHEASNRRSL